MVSPHASPSRLVRTALLALGCRVVTAQWPQDVDVGSFVATERAIALNGALQNIGPNGSLVQGAGAGFVVASPDKTNPDCELLDP